MSVKLTKFPAGVQLQDLKNRDFQPSPTGTFFAARLNLYPGAQLQYIFFHCAAFHSIPPRSMGDLGRIAKSHYLKNRDFRSITTGTLFAAR